MTMLLMFVYILFWTFNISLSCPVSCTCDVDLICVMDCDSVRTNNTFNYGLKQFNSAKFINKCDVNNFHLNFVNLTIKLLDISENSIEKFNILVNFTGLEKIDLSNNDITVIEGSTYSQYKNLKELNVRSNRLVALYNDSFIGLSSLETLDLSNNRLKELNRYFHPLSKLQRLNLSSNVLEYISHDCFNDLLSLLHLDISNNNITKLAPGVFQFLPNLSKLLMGNNPHLGTSHVERQLFVGSGSKIQHVDISRIGLAQIPEAFTHSIRFLILTGNSITSIQSGELDSYPLLQLLVISENGLISVEIDALGRLELLRILYLNGNKLTTPPKSLPEELKMLSLSRNHIEALTMEDFTNLFNLKILLLQNNLIQHLGENVFTQLQSLEVLDLSNNPIKELHSIVLNGPLTLRDLRLCHLNKVVSPAKDLAFPLQTSERLQMLHLKGSPGLAKQFLTDSAFLAALPRLQYLDLRLNNITDVRDDLLFYLTQLKMLRLDGNNINCSVDSWGNDWLPMINASINDEMCYFSSMSDAINEYDCKFPELFDIHEDLPPINSYSELFLNKLIDYYSIFDTSNDTTKPITNEKNNNKIVAKKEDSVEIFGDENEILPKYGFKNKLRVIDIISQRGKEHKILDLKNEDNVINKSTNQLESNNIIRKTGKSINKAVNETKMVVDNYGANITALPYAASRKALEDDTKTSELLNKNNKAPNGFQFITITSIIIIVAIIIVVIKLKRKKRKEHTASRERPDEMEQIEIANISSGVLW